MQCRAAGGEGDGCPPLSLSNDVLTGYGSPTMQQQLGQSALRLPSSLAELRASPLFSAAAAAAQEGPPAASEVAALLPQARRQPVTALDWGLLLHALSSGQLQGSQPAQLVAVLSWAADSAREQLEAAAAAGGRPSGGGGSAAAAPAATDVGDPRLRQALQNTLKLSLFFLCCLVRGEGTSGGDAEHPAPAGGGSGKRGGKKAKAGAGATVVEALAQLRAQRDALLAAGTIEDALHDSRALLPAVSDLRAAGRLVRGAALHCLVHPPPAGAGGGDRAAKELAEARFQAAAGVFVSCSRLWVLHTPCGRECLLHFRRRLLSLQAPSIPCPLFASGPALL